jgi:uncharacterized membrane protein
LQQTQNNPNTTEENREIKRYMRVVYTVILMIALLWCGGILLAPLWQGEPDFRGSVSDFLYTFFSASCHQLPERSLFLAGAKLGVCSRCTMIYFGFLLTTIIYPFVKKLSNIELPALWILFTGVALVALDAGLEIFHLHNNSFFSREITGAILGMILPFYIIPGTVRLFEEFFSPPKVVPKK